MVPGLMVLRRNVADDALRDRKEVLCVAEGPKSSCSSS